MLLAALRVRHTRPPLNLTAVVSVSTRLSRIDCLCVDLLTPVGRFRTTRQKPSVSIKRLRSRRAAYYARSMCARRDPPRKLCTYRVTRRCRNCYDRNQFYNGSLKCSRPIEGVYIFKRSGDF